MYKMNKGGILRRKYILSESQEGNFLGVSDHGNEG